MHFYQAIAQIREYLVDYSSYETRGLKRCENEDAEVVLTEPESGVVLFDCTSQGKAHMTLERDTAERLKAQWQGPLSAELAQETATWVRGHFVADTVKILAMRFLHGDPKTTAALVPAAFKSKRVAEMAEAIKALLPSAPSAPNR